MATSYTDAKAFQEDLAQHPRGPRYDVSFANAFSLRMGDNDCTLRFMLSENPNDLDTAELQTAVILTPRSAKVLAGILLEAVIEIEHQSGMELPVKSDTTKKLFDAARAVWTPDAETSSDSTSS